ncbi:hypothetical protein FIBSPDRAFT_941359 [Athelia psychrophila]|uniref:Uncharacterized protein n=1 Tax=Athelia psychrophila TaxID=1759441 RepID=A0A167UAY0_9AGAM|nr:hypothetical protein FIBSPDRAFT_941359 [Fibularhizoctonia sp. CBS 109695]
MDPARLSHLIDVTPATLAAVQLQQHTQTAAYFAAVAWDWTLAIGEELQIAKRCGRSLAVLAYFLARSSGVMAFGLTLVFLIKVPPYENRCSALLNWIGVTMMVGSAAKAYLFLLRVRAIYDNSKLVTLFSGVGWLAVVCARMTFAFMVNISPPKQTGRCAITDLGSLPIISLWLNAAYDTCIFVSVSVRLASYANLTGTPWISSFIRGYGLPPTMRHLLKDAQKYYGIKRNVSSITILFTLLSAVIAVLPVNPIYQAIALAPAIAVETVMTCKVFRSMILRSLHPIQNVKLSKAPAEARTTAMSIFELDTFMELRIRRTNTEHEQVW